MFSRRTIGLSTIRHYLRISYKLQPTCVVPTHVSEIRFQKSYRTTFFVVGVLRVGEDVGIFKRVNYRYLIVAQHFI